LLCATCDPARCYKKWATQSPRSTFSRARSQLVQAQARDCETGGEVLGEAGGAAAAEGGTCWLGLALAPVLVKRKILPPLEFAKVVKS